MHLLRSNRRFRVLFAASTTSLIGDWFGFVAINVLAVQGHAGPFDLAIVFAAHALPAAGASPFAGAIVDRFDRRRVLVLADAFAALLTLGMALAASVHALHALEALLVLRSVVTSLVPPAESAAVRRIVQDHELVAANTALTTSWSLTYVVGMALGGFAASVGVVAALLLDAFTFALASAMHARLPAMPVGSRSNLMETIAETPRDTASALAIAAQRPRLLAALLGKAPIALGSGAGWVAMSELAAASSSAHRLPIALGLFQAVRGAGTAIGPMIRARFASSPRRHAVDAAARALVVVSLASMAVSLGPLALATVALAWGIGSGSNWVAVHAELLRRSGDAVIGRLAAFDELLVASTTVVGTFAGAAAVVIWDVPAAAVVAAVLTLGAGGLSRWFVGRSVLRAKARERVPNRLAPAGGAPYLRPLPSEDSCPAKSLPV